MDISLYLMMIFNPSLKHYEANGFIFKKQNVRIFLQVAVYIYELIRLITKYVFLSFTISLFHLYIISNLVMKLVRNQPVAGGIFDRI